MAEPEPAVEPRAAPATVAEVEAALIRLAKIVRNDLNGDHAQARAKIDAWLAEAGEV